MVMPNFLIIGAHKAGTTSLHQYLSQHPDIYMSPLKEARFWAYDHNDPNHRRKVLHSFPITTLEKYKKLFDGVSKEKAIGETSPTYLLSSKVPLRLKSFIPDARLIASLRNPVEQAYSLYQMELRAGRRLPESPLKFSTNDKLLEGGFYYANLKPFFKLFERTQIKVIIFEEWILDTLQTLRDIFQFLDVDDAFEPDIKVWNPSGIPKIKTIHSIHKIFRHKSLYRLKPLIPQRIRSFYRQVMESNLAKAQPLMEEVRQYLLHIYYNDIVKLQDLLDRDLSIWFGKK
jgi:Sulfotransferase domain.